MCTGARFILQQVNWVIAEWLGDLLASYVIFIFAAKLNYILQNKFQYQLKWLNKTVEKSLKIEIKAPDHLRWIKEKPRLQEIFRQCVSATDALTLPAVARNAHSRTAWHIAHNMYTHSR